MLSADIEKRSNGVCIRGAGFAYPAGPNAGKLAIGGVDLWEFVREYFHLHYTNPAYLGELELAITVVAPPVTPR